MEWTQQPSTAEPRTLTDTQTASWPQMSTMAHSHGHAPSLPRSHAYVAAAQPAAYSDYEARELRWSTPDRYAILARIGHGKFSEVFLARQSTSDSDSAAGTEDDSVNESDDDSMSDTLSGIGATRVAIKLLKPIKKAKIKREIHVLTTLAASPRIITLYDTVRDPRSKYCSLVLEYVPINEPKLAFPSYHSFIHYCHQLLFALNDCHSAGVMHRDIKPQNISINFATRSLKLLDFGLSEFYLPYRDYPHRVASRYFKAPELLCQYRYYHYAIDLWSVGCIIAGWVFNVHPLFKGEDSNDQLITVIEDLIGLNAFIKWMARYAIALPEPIEPRLCQCKRLERRPWREFSTSKSSLLPLMDGQQQALVFDLLDRLLDIDHQSRITADEALQHPLFKGFADHHQSQASQSTVDTDVESSNPSTATASPSQALSSLSIRHTLSPSQSP